MARQLIDLQAMNAGDIANEDLMLIRDVSEKKDKKIPVSEFVDTNSAAVAKLIDIMYPVGRYLSTFGSEDPNTTYPNTVWVKQSEFVERTILSTKVLHWSTGSVTGTTTKQKVLGVYGLDMLTSMLNSKSGMMTVPTGYHIEYKMQAELSTGGDIQVKLFLNNIETNFVQTWSSDTFRQTAATDFFRSTDIVQEMVVGYGQVGINFGWVANNANNVIRVYLPTLSAYLVSDTPTVRWKRTS